MGSGAIISVLQALEEDIIKCMKCGNCQAVCPLYAETRSEPAVARGKVRLAGAVLKGEVEYTQRLAEHFDLCLTCMACVANCPCGVRVNEIVMAARAVVAEKIGLSMPKRAAVAGLSRPALLDAGIRAASLTQGLLFKTGERGMLPRFPIGLEMRRVVPRLPGYSLKEILKEGYSVPAPVKRVAFFAGCVTCYVYTGVGRAVVDVLLGHGVEVVFPKEQHCCGAPVLLAGDRKTAAAMARSQVEIFSAVGADAVVTVCGTCGESFRHYYPQLLDGGKDLQRAKLLAERTFDITEFLTDVAPLKKDLLGPLEETFTYHEPCHLGRGLGVYEQPVRLLAAVPGAEYAPLKQPGRCCGGAGFFGLKHYDLSLKVLQTKLRDIATTGAHQVVTGCGSCRIHLDDGLARHRMPHQVLHTVEMLARSMREVSRGWGY